MEEEDLHLSFDQIIDESEGKSEKTLENTSQSGLEASKQEKEDCSKNKMKLMEVLKQSLLLISPVKKKKKMEGSDEAPGEIPGLYMELEPSNDDRTKKRKMEKEEDQYYDIKEEVRYDPDEIRANIRKHLIEKIDLVNEKREVIKKTLNRNSEKMKKEMRELKEKQDLETKNLDRKLDEDKIEIEKKYRIDKTKMLSRHAKQNTSLKQKLKIYRRTDEENQKILKDLTKSRNQLGDDLRKLDLDPNDVDKLEKARTVLECPICMESMLPPMKIWMCSGSHSVCEGCKGGFKENLCPTCRTKEVTIRNLAMEEVARALFN